MNQIFKTIAVIIIAVSMQHLAKAQTNVPFYNIGSTNVLPNSSIINSGEAYRRISSLLGSRRAKYEREYTHYKGQYYFKDNLVINIRVNTYPPKTSRYKILSEMKKAYDAFFSQESRPETYFSVIKKISNYHVLINYLLDNNTSKDAFIIDEEGRYMIFVNVYGAKDAISIQKAIDMVNQIANTITFIDE